MSLMKVYAKISMLLNQQLHDSLLHSQRPIVKFPSIFWQKILLQEEGKGGGGIALTKKTIP